MKLLKISSMMAAVATAGFCMSAAATGEGQSEKLELTDPVTNVLVTVAATVGGGDKGWNVEDVPAPATEGSGVDAYFDIDCDAAASNQFTAAAVTTEEIVKCSFTLQPAPVPHTGSLTAPDGDAQVAFCIATNTTTGVVELKAFGKGFSDWKTLTGSIPTNDYYTLTITFDYTGSDKYAKFAIDGVDLTEGGKAWFEITPDKAGVQEYCFIGSGALKSILTTGQNVKAELEPATIDGKTVKVAVPEAQVSAVAAAATTTSKTVAEVLATTASTVVTGAPSDMTVAEAIALGLVEAEGSTLKATASEIKVQPNALEENEGFTMGVNVAKPEGSNATVTYTLLGSADGNTFAPISNYVDLDEQPVVPKSLVGKGSGQYLFFKVKVSVTYPNN